MGEKRPHPVVHLQELFAVVAGVAIVFSIERIIDTSPQGPTIDWGAVALFVAFGVTALTFFSIRLCISTSSTWSRNSARSGTPGRSPTW